MDRPHGVVTEASVAKSFDIMKPEKDLDLMLATSAIDVVWEPTRERSTWQNRSNLHRFLSL